MYYVFGAGSVNSNNSQRNACSRVLLSSAGLSGLFLQRRVAGAARCRLRSKDKHRHNYRSGISRRKEIVKAG